MKAKDKASPGKAAEGVPEIQGALRSAISNIVRALGSVAGVVALWDEAKRKPFQLASYGLNKKTLAQIESLIDQSLPKFEGEASSKKALTELSRQVLKGSAATALGTFHVVALPLRNEGRLTGLIFLFHPSESPQLIVDHPAVYNIILDEVGIVIQNARLLQRLVEEKRWLEAVIRNSADGILIVDRDQRILGFNPALEGMAGWRVEEVQGRSCQEVLRLAAAPDVQENLAFFQTEGHDGLCPVEALLLTRDGRHIAVEANYSAIHGDSGEVLGGVIGLRDITARKEAQELQSTFLSVVSHELQTPIAIIEGYAGILSEEGLELPKDQLQQKLRVIREESRLLSKMVENLLYASRIQAGGLELRREPVDLPSLSRRVAQRMEPISKKHTITIDLPHPFPTVMADYERVQEVLTNLLDNAMKYSPKGGTILIEGEVRSGEVAISVVDSGRGIPQADRERVFDRFFRRGGGLTNMAKGTGLGLFICKSIVEAHGGRIWVEPDPGGGARFRFTLPRLEPAALPAIASDMFLTRTRK
ncbi:MAG: ATP-binding protein [Dehalococcoidia bacterium]|nr:ATP-binding protein [Dehalococcoidia bacterium]